VPEEIDVVILPLMTIGHSPEHAGFAGNFSHRAELLLEAWVDVARVFHAAGGRRLIVVSSHGGNSDIVALLVNRLRVELKMLAVSAAWLRFGTPKGLFDEREPAYGIHGGEIETSLMLHYWPEAVRADKVQDFASTAEAWDLETRHLKMHGRIRPGWTTADLNTAGAVGNAAAATGKKGAALAHHILGQFAELVGDVASFDLGRLRDLS
jgi:creatinine amidohydrolase